MFRYSTNNSSRVDCKAASLYTIWVKQIFASAITLLRSPSFHSFKDTFAHHLLYRLLVKHIRSSGLSSNFNWDRDIVDKKRKTKKWLRLRENWLCLKVWPLDPWQVRDAIWRPAWPHKWQPFFSNKYAFVDSHLRTYEINILVTLR